MSNLKACPAGHPAEVRVSPPFPLGGGSMSLWLAHGACPTCAWSGPHCHGDTEAYVRTEAARLWNTRPPVVPVEALRELLSDSFSGEDELRGRISELIDYAREDT